MLAVLPLQNLSDNPSDDHFSDGLTSELITRLGGLSPDALGVIAWSAVKPYQDVAAGVVGDELGVEYVVDGSVQREDGRVRVNVQLVRTRDESLLWAESYEQAASDMLAVQRDVGRAVARQIELTLTPEKERELFRVGHVDPEAYQSFLLVPARPRQGH